MKRPKAHEEHENEERWLLTYADLITLLMAFFVIMYALSRSDKQNFQKLAMSLAAAFPTNNSRTPLPMPGIGGRRGSESTSIMRSDQPGAKTPRGDTKKNAMQRLAEEFQALAIKEKFGDSVQISSDPKRHRISVRMSAALLFAPGKAELAPEAIPIIDKMAALLAGASRPIRVEGHTDNTPISNAQFNSNWELSTARAATVIRYMIERRGFPPKLLSASGYGEYRPIAPNDTPEDRAKNRRVEFVINAEEDYDEPDEAVAATQENGN